VRRRLAKRLAKVADENRTTDLMTSEQENENVA